MSPPDSSRHRAAERIARQVLLGPAFVARAAATRVGTEIEAWMLRQPKEIRESYVHAVVDANGDEARLAEIWMLRQTKAVRESYIREVLEKE